MFITILHRRFRRGGIYLTQELYGMCSYLFDTGVSVRGWYIFDTGVSVGGVVYNLHKRFRRRVHNYFTQEV